MTFSPLAAPVRPTSGQRAWDVVLYVLGFLVTTIAVMNPPLSWSDGEVSGSAALLWLVSVGAWATVFFRRSNPMVVVVAGGVLALIGTEYLLLLIGLHHAMVAASKERRLWIAGAGVAAVALFWVREATTSWGDEAALATNGGAASDIVLSGVIALASLGATFAFTTVAVGKRATESQRARADAEHTIATQLGDELARQSERSEIAREIHDGLTNRLALLSMMSANVERSVKQGDERAVGLARELQEQARLALTDLRSLVQDLRTEPQAAPTPLKSMRAVGDVISATRAAGTPVDAIVILDGASQAPQILDAAVYRLVQEALTNAVKHAPGRAVSLYLEANPASGVRLRVTNPLVTGTHHGSGRGAGAGLIGIQERVAALQGTVWMGPHEGEFIVDVTVPWINPAEVAANTVSPASPRVTP
ncbi:sensor histidine kinase [Demequina sediminicola]|uniref:sensor histidine kinase n=1 Tax=Demequina sediminicola TaxID=1095026 RepID=UPI0007826B03|nr:histidine kinase [Demequina sediminicola]